MPAFANVAAYVVIDTLALLMWHQVFFSRISRSSFCPPHLKRLIEYYHRQCQPGPLPLLDTPFFKRPDIAMLEVAPIDDLA